LDVLFFLLHTFESWRRITHDTRIVFYDEGVCVIDIARCSGSWRLISTPYSLLSLWEILLEVAEVVVVIGESSVVATWCYIIWTIISGVVV
jgi:hypothetical protein